MHDPIAELNQELFTANPAERRAILRALVPTAKRWIEASIDADATGAERAAAQEWTDYLRATLVEPLALSVGHGEQRTATERSRPSASTGHQ